MGQEAVFFSVFGEICVSTSFTSLSNFWLKKFMSWPEFFK